MDDVFSPCYKCEYHRLNCHAICTPYKLYQSKLADKKAHIAELKEMTVKSHNTRAKHWDKKWFKKSI